MIFLEKLKKDKKELSLRRHLKLSTQYFIFACCLIISICLLALFISYIDYRNFNANTEREIINETKRIDNYLLSVFDEVYRINIFMGRQIIQHGVHDTAYIYKLFHNYINSKSESQSILSWSHYDFTNAKHNVIVNSNLGVLSSAPINISFRSYIKKAQYFPWTLQFSNPIIGIPSRQWIIAAATGLTLKQNYLGAIVTGFNLQVLTKKIEDRLGNKYISFLILDTNGNLISASSNNLLLFGQQLHINNINAKQLSYKMAGFLNSPIVINGNKYQYFLKLKNYPFLIITGTDSNIINKEFHHALKQKLIEFLGISTTLVIMMIIFNRRFVKPIIQLSEHATSIVAGQLNFKWHTTNTIEIANLTKALLKVKRYLLRHKRLQQQLASAMKSASDSDKAKEHFIRQAHAELKIPITNMFHYIESLKSLLLKQKCIDNEIYLNLLNQIQLAATELKNFARAILQLKEENIAALLKECICITKKMAIEKNVYFKVKIADDLPLAHLDAFRIKQVIVSLLYSAINNSQANSTIYVSCDLKIEKIIQYIDISIKDTGFGLNETEQKRLKSKFSMTNSSNGLELEMDTIQKLIDLHQGQLVINNEWGLGTRVSLLLPCNQSIDSEKTNSNIVYLFKSNPSK